jgi:hypothetical protein
MQKKSEELLVLLYLLLCLIPSFLTTLLINDNLFPNFNINLLLITVYIYPILDTFIIIFCRYAWPKENYITKKVITTITKYSLILLTIGIAVSIIHIILRILLPQFNNLFEYNSNKAYLLIYILEIMIITLILLIREKKIFNIANVNIGFNKIFLQFLTFSSSQLVIFILTIFCNIENPFFKFFYSFAVYCSFLQQGFQYLLLISFKIKLNL